MPGGKVGFANILAKNIKAATYRGKLIVEGNGGNKALYLDDAAADDIVANDVPFSLYKNRIASGVPYNLLRFDDNTPVTVADTISINEVPDDAEAWFVLEPAYVLQS